MEADRNAAVCLDKMNAAVLDPAVNRARVDAGDSRRILRRDHGNLRATYGAPGKRRFRVTLDEENLISLHRDFGASVRPLFLHQHSVSIRTARHVALGVELA